MRKRPPLDWRLTRNRFEESPDVGSQRSLPLAAPADLPDGVFGGANDGIASRTKKRPGLCCTSHYRLKEGSVVATKVFRPQRPQRGNGNL
jgi:hypothetical protein